MTIGARPSDSSSHSSTLGIAHQRAADRDHLLLAARQRGRRAGGACPAGSGTAGRGAPGSTGPARRATRPSAGSPRPTGWGTAAGPPAPARCPRRTISPGGRPPIGSPVEADLARAAPSTRPVSALRKVHLPAPLAPMIATSSPARKLEVDAEQRLGVAVERRQAVGRQQQRRHASMPRYTRRTSASAITARGAPSASLLAEVDDEQPVGDRQQRVHHVLDPDHGHALRLDAASARRPARRASCSVSPPAISSSSSSFGRVASARASSSRLRSSSVRLPAGRLACASSPVCSSTSCAVSQAARSRWPPPKQAAVDQVLEHRHARRRAAAPGSCGRCRRGSAGAASARVTSRPSYSTRPGVARARRR